MEPKKFSRYRYKNKNKYSNENNSENTEQIENKELEVDDDNIKNGNSSSKKSDIKSKSLDLDNNESSNKFKGAKENDNNFISQKVEEVTIKKSIDENQEEPEKENGAENKKTVKKRVKLNLITFINENKKEKGEESDANEKKEDKEYDYRKTEIDNSNIKKERQKLLLKLLTSKKFNAKEDESDEESEEEDDNESKNRSKEDKDNKNEYEDKKEEKRKDDRTRFEKENVEREENREEEKEEKEENRKEEKSEEKYKNKERGEPNKYINKYRNKINRKKKSEESSENKQNDGNKNNESSGKKENNLNYENNDNDEDQEKYENKNNKNIPKIQEEVNVQENEIIEVPKNDSKKNKRGTIPLCDTYLKGDIKHKNDNNNNNSNENQEEFTQRSTEIPINQRDRLTINIKPKNENERNIYSYNNKKEKENKYRNSPYKNKNEEEIIENENNNEEENNNEKYLEKENEDNIGKKENENIINEENNEDNEDNENKERELPEVYNGNNDSRNKNRKLNNVKYDDKKKNNDYKYEYEIGSLPTKKFRDEEEEDDYNQKRQLLNLRKQNRNNNYNNDYKHQYETNFNKYRRMNYNKKIQNFYDSRNYRTIDNLNDKDYNNVNVNFNPYKNLNNSINNLRSKRKKNSLQNDNEIIINNIKTGPLDNSFDAGNIYRNPLKRQQILKENYSNNQTDLYKNYPTKSDQENNPKKTNLHEGNYNRINNDQKESNSIKVSNIVNPVYNNSPCKINQPTMGAYVKKSPISMRNFNLNKSGFKDKSPNNAINNNLNSIEFSTIYGLNSSIDSKLTGNTSKNTNNKNNRRNINKNNRNSSENMDNINIEENNLDNGNYINDNINNNQKHYFKKSKPKEVSLNLEDVMIIEEKLNNIIYTLETSKPTENQCFNFWNYFFNCSFYNILEKIFINKEDSNTVRLSINYELMSVMLCYELSFEKDVLDEQGFMLLMEILELNYFNLIIICDYILTKIHPDNTKNIWVMKLREIVEKANCLQNTFPVSLLPIEKINYNTNEIVKNIKSLLMDYNTQNNNILINFLRKISTKTYSEINEFFQDNIIRVENYEGSLVASAFLKKNPYFHPLPSPYITLPNKKPYTLVLDLDETLVNFKLKSNKEGTLRARPYLFGFLEEVSHYYELIVFTSATKAYADSLIEAIEYEKEYFDYVFYRDHAIIINNDFVKDLTRIGRPLDSTIIIDDMPQNFRLQKENGINIKPFWGDDSNDTALYELIPILMNIAEEGCDVRDGLEKYRDEIVEKVTSNISKHNA